MANPLQQSLAQETLISQLSPGTPIRYAFDRKEPRLYKPIPSVIIIDTTKARPRKATVKSSPFRLAAFREKIPHLRRPRKQFEEGIIGA